MYFLFFFFCLVASDSSKLRKKVILDFNTYSICILKNKEVYQTCLLKKIKMFIVSLTKPFRLEFVISEFEPPTGM